MDPVIIKKRIRSLMKAPRKKSLEFGMNMFENGSFPKVRFLSAITHILLLYGDRGENGADTEG
jgi:hypothetical protein